ncbi:hypothetical protein AG4045_030743 [Apium graveolens]|uniref:Uncharacterized protein n=1 Tax=Apium graveolens TaxID=4045 RepID=A0A6L5B7K1_APIGR|nr:hypothetical protein AG4045_030743 [Apium graveolens]
MDTLKRAFDRAEPNFSNILKIVRPDLLIYDFMRPWPADAAKRLKIPAVQFIATSSAMTSVMLHVYKAPGFKFPFSKIYYRDYERVHEEKLRIKSVENDLVMKSLERSTDIILIKGFKEMDGKYSKYLSAMTQKRVVQVGPLVQLPTCKDENCEIIQWLNKKEKGSTIFVSFGMIKKVVVDKDGEAARKKAKQMKNKIKRKEEEYIDEMVKELLKICKKKNF